MCHIDDDNRIHRLEQVIVMKHMKDEPISEHKSVSNVPVCSTKQEDDSEVDEDTMTVAEVSQHVEKTIPQRPKDKPQQNKRANQDFGITGNVVVAVPNAMRIEHRRSTMAPIHKSSMMLPVARRKRRLSTDEKTSSTIPPSKSTSLPKHTNESTTANEVKPNSAKKMRIDCSEQPKQSTTKTTEPKTPEKTNNSVAKTPAQKSNSTPSSTGKHQMKATTPRITSFFTSKPRLWCKKCNTKVLSEKELQFHTKIQEKGRCAKCKKTVDTKRVSTHMISCLLLNNKMPQLQLNRLLMARVDLKNLSTKNIEQINLSLHKEKRNGTAERSTRVEKEDKLERKEKKKSSKDDTSENRRSSKNDKNKKSNRKSLNREDEDAPIIKSLAIAISWTDDAVSHNRVFSVRNTESNTKIYTDIKSTSFLSMAEKAIHEKIIKKITSIEVEAEAEAIRKATSNATNMVQSNANGQASSSTPNGNANVPNNPTKTVQYAPKPSQRSNEVTVITKSSQQVPNGSRKSSTPTNRPIAPHTLSTSSPVHGPNNSSAANTPKSSGVAITPIRSTMMAAPVPPPTAIAQSASSTQITPFTPNDTNSATVSKVPQMLPLPKPFRNRSMSTHYSHVEHAQQFQPVRRQSFYMDNAPKPVPPPTMHQQASQLITYSNQNININRQQYQMARHNHIVMTNHNNTQNVMININQNVMVNPIGNMYVASKPVPTKIVDNRYVQRQSSTPPQVAKVQNVEMARQSMPGSTLKVLTPDDLNSRLFQNSNQAEATSSQLSPDSTENSANLNNNRPVPKKGPRTKTTPMRANKICDDDDININVTLSSIGSDQAELLFNFKNPNTNKAVSTSYDDLSEKRQTEVQNSLLKNQVWLQMLSHLKTRKGTAETLALFRRILPPKQREIFFNELKKCHKDR